MDIEGEAPLLLVKNAMNGVLMHADVNANLYQLTRLLIDGYANAIIVRQGGVPKGIVTAKDILRSLTLKNRNPGEILAGDIMSSPIVSVDHDKGLEHARRIVLESGKRKLAVRKDFDIIGLLVLDDMIRDLSWYR